MIFGEIWSKSLYYIVQGLLSDFGATLKIHKKSKFDQNQLKLSTQPKYMYMQGFIYWGWGWGGKVLPQTQYLPPQNFNENLLKVYI